MMESQRHLSHTRSPKLARDAEVTERSRFAQGAEVSQNARKQACLLLHQQAAHYLDLLREPEANLVQQVNRRFAQYPVNQIYGV